MVHVNLQWVSVYLTIGNSIVVCSVVGPVEVKSRQEKYDRCTIKVSWSSQHPDSICKDKFMADKLLKFIESTILTKKYPRSMINISVQVVSEDGSLLAVAFNAAMVALMEAGVTQSICLYAVGCVIKNGNVMVDSCLDEEEDAESVHVLVFNEKKCVSHLSFGSFTLEQLDSCIDACNQDQQFFNYFKHQ